MPAPKTRPPASSTPVLRSVRSIVGQASYCLWAGEDAAEYDALYDLIIGDVRPVDAVEEVLAAEIVALTLEVRRLRHLRKMYMKSNAALGLGPILADLLYSEDAAYDLTRDWGRGKPSARNRVDRLLREAGIGVGDVQARILFARMDDFERLDRMILNCDRRRSDILKEMENRRNGMARRARDLEIEDADVVNETPARDRTPLHAGHPNAPSPAEVINGDDAHEDQDEDPAPTEAGDTGDNVDDDETDPEVHQADDDAHDEDEDDDQDQRA
jgi:hypothetical protein